MKRTASRADVVDASVVIASFRAEPLTARAVSAIDRGVLMSAANLAEVATWLALEGLADQIPDIRDSANLAVVPLTEDMALVAGALEPVTRAFGLSLADRCCLATAMAFDATMLTTDRAWLELPEPYRDRVELVRPD